MAALEDKVIDTSSVIDTKRGVKNFMEEKFMIHTEADMVKFL